MSQSDRREFLADVGRGMLVASLGSTLALDLGLASAFDEVIPKRLRFGELEPLVDLMQDTPPHKLQTRLVDRIHDGTTLKTLVAAGALANARCFGGQDYTGYHAFMALPPALAMSEEMPAEKKALPVLKVLYRNTVRMQEHGGRKNEILHPIAAEVAAELSGEKLQADVRTGDFDKAEKAFVSKMDHDAKPAFEALQFAIQDEIDVHRVVLAWRAWSMLDIAGKEHAHTLLRQSVRFCVHHEKDRLDRKRGEPAIRKLLPKLFDEHKLAGFSVGTKVADDAWTEKLAETIYSSTREKAAEAAAMALAEGFSPAAVGEAMSLAATRLVLRDPGRTNAESGKPKGSVHGASIGVHASDAANAWRNIAAVCGPRNAVASMIVGAYHTAGQSRGPKDFAATAESPKVNAKDAAAVLAALESAVKAKDQAQAVTLVTLYGQAGHDAKKVFEVLVRYAISEDGALHAEKYYRTAVEEFARTREAHRWLHLAALARVTASECGFPAAGYEEACQLLKV